MIEEKALEAAEFHACVLPNTDFLYWRCQKLFFFILCYEQVRKEKWQGDIKIDLQRIENIL